MEMRVREYLKFRARLKGLNRSQSRDGVNTVIEQCSLEDVHKADHWPAFQRVQAACRSGGCPGHEPELIILDEPTIGLDPNQIRSVRELIKVSAANTPYCSPRTFSGSRNDLHSRADSPSWRDHGSRHDGESASHHLPDGAGNCRNRRAGSELMQAWAEMETIMHVDVAAIDGEFNRCSLTPRDGYRPSSSCL
jgi:ABC-2 type transport system ATP-binding protein